MRKETLDQFLDRLEYQRLIAEGHDFTELDRESKKDWQLNRQSYALERVIERLG